MTMTQSSVQIPELPLRSEYGYLSDSNLRLGGRLKVRPEDFIVEEIPAYEPCGDGEHLFLWIEKRDLSAESLTTFVAKKLGIGRDAIGMAGLKDRRAITRQYLSVPARCADKVPTVESDSVKVLRSKRHRNKLHTGHLKGNRFEILLRDATALNSVSPCVSEGAQPVDSDNVADRSAIRSMAKEDSLVRGVLIPERSATLSGAPHQRTVLVNCCFFVAVK